MSKLGLLVGAAFMTVVAWSVDARATQTLTNPFGNTPVSVNIGSDQWGQWIGWKNVNTGTCSWQLIGDTNGLTDNYLVVGGDGNDGLVVLSAPSTFCGFPLGVPLYNGHFLDMNGGGGNDNVWSNSTLDTFLFGGLGNDWISSSRPSSVVNGQMGNDLIMQGGTGTGGFKSGEGGDDCLFINPSVSSTSMSCGDGNDRWSGPGSKPADCEIQDNSCCGFCPIFR